MSNSNSTASSGMGLSGWLTVLFVGLKLTGHITWPWIWVVSPLWITLSILLAILVILLILKAVFDALDNR